MEDSSENADSPKNPDQLTNPGDKNTGAQDTRALLQQISSELAALKRSETTRALLYTIFFGLLLGVAFYSVTLQGNRMQDLESDQIKMNKTMKALNSELYNEIQRMDDLLSGEIPGETPDSSAAGNALFVRLIINH